MAATEFILLWVYEKATHWCVYILAAVVAEYYIAHTI